MYSEALKEMQNWKRMYNGNNRIWQRWEYTLKEIDGLNINKHKERKWDKEGRLEERKWNSNKGEWRAALSKIHAMIFFF